MRRKVFAVIGAGRFGCNLALSLVEMGHDVLVADIDEKKIQELADKVTHAVQMDSTVEQNLKELGVKNFDAVIVGIGVDMQASILTSILLKELGTKRILAKANSTLHGKVLKKIGVDRVIFPEKDMGQRLARLLTVANFIDCIDIFPGYAVTEVVAPGQMAGKSLKELNLRAKYGINVIAIRSGESLNVSPLADDIIQANDFLILIGKNKTLEILLKD